VIVYFLDCALLNSGLFFSKSDKGEVCALGMFFLSKVDMFLVNVQRCIISNSCVKSVDQMGVQETDKPLYS
jgi:hypothetical protein